jgi:Fic family protein
MQMKQHLSTETLHQVTFAHHRFIWIHPFGKDKGRFGKFTAWPPSSPNTILKP